jgi:hypothetical protein
MQHREMTASATERTSLRRRRSVVAASALALLGLVAAVVHAVACADVDRELRSLKPRPGMDVQEVWPSLTHGVAIRFVVTGDHEVRSAVWYAASREVVLEK